MLLRDENNVVNLRNRWRVRLESRVQREEWREVRPGREAGNPCKLRGFVLISKTDGERLQGLLCEGWIPIFISEQSTWLHRAAWKREGKHGGRESNEAHNAEVLGRGEGGLDEGGMERREQI